MDKYQLEVVGITYNQIESGVYALILQQIGTNRRIPIIIGFPEAQAIECKMQEVVTPRPLTHDTMATMMAAFGLRLTEVYIYKLPTGAFAADLIMTDGASQRIVDSRSSDAIALALRVGAPIFTSEEVIRECGFDSNDPEVQTPDRVRRRLTGAPSSTSVTPAQRRSDLSNMTLSQLSEAMLKAAENENYEEAARIKIEIDSRNAQK